MGKDSLPNEMKSLPLDYLNAIQEVNDRWEEGGRPPKVFETFGALEVVKIALSGRVIQLADAMTAELNKEETPGSD